MSFIVNHKKVTVRDCIYNFMLALFKLGEVQSRYMENIPSSCNVHCELRAGFTYYG